MGGGEQFGGGHEMSGPLIHQRTAKVLLLSTNTICMHIHSHLCSGHLLQSPLCRCAGKPQSLAAERGRKAQDTTHNSITAVLHAC